MARVTIDFPADRVVFIHDVDVRIGDLNYFEHVGHDAMISLLHEARARLFVAHGHHESDTDGGACIVGDLAITYRAEAKFGQVLRIEIACGSMETFGVELYYRVSQRDGETVVALAKTGHVFFDGKNPKLVKIPESFKTMMQQRIG